MSSFRAYDDCTSTDSPAPSSTKATSRSTHVRCAPVYGRLIAEVGDLSYCPGRRFGMIACLADSLDEQYTTNIEKKCGFDHTWSGSIWLRDSGE